ncbi:hypothetical protein TNCT_623741 [Trichonephila clavata]|uniref:Uncharacterized protein n=1 Tax=Trichonephila clavata TaxID=2740835 RepID=A0A8X6FJA7_TRICU|nr:hypothetical protein TNCT_623741 [Trichonephila clavata]
MDPRIDNASTNAWHGHFYFLSEPKVVFLPVAMGGYAILLVTVLLGRTMMDLQRKVITRGIECPKMAGPD